MAAYCEPGEVVPRKTRIPSRAPGCLQGRHARQSPSMHARQGTSEGIPSGARERFEQDIYGKQWGSLDAAYARNLQNYKWQRGL